MAAAFTEPTYVSGDPALAKSADDVANVFQASFYVRFRVYNEI